MHISFFKSATFWLTVIFASPQRQAFKYFYLMHHNPLYYNIKCQMLFRWVCRPGFAVLLWELSAAKIPSRLSVRESPLESRDSHMVSHISVRTNQSQLCSESVCVAWGCRVCLPLFSLTWLWKAGRDPGGSGRSRTWQPPACGCRSHGGRADPGLELITVY